MKIAYLKYIYNLCKSSATKTQSHKKSLKYLLLSKKEEFIAETIADTASIE